MYAITLIAAPCGSMIAAMRLLLVDRIWPPTLGGKRMAGAGRQSNNAAHSNEYDAGRIPQPRSAR